MRETPIVVCGDFNNQIYYMYRKLHSMGSSHVLDPGTVTHIMGVDLDKAFTRREEIINALVNDGFDSGITDQKCLKVTLKLK
jgi:hypothetical protein